ncbi:arsenate reductase/protein-tyrosine-phosphatase family protein [Halorussus salinus]|uniref:arsenate reductase/protein-tyrosine-phosphatase family protein n=1 Tax=Halorussus salinus TaxID=1364935 RepID=UPI00109294F0|nr:low molecular weight phosphatase family protein [Halorussus salinus]
MTTVAFVCVQNAGRSQMATAFAEREVRERREASEPTSVRRAGRTASGEAGSDDPRADEREASEEGAESVEILTGGTDPADHVHDEVVEVMAERGFDLSERTPREITHDELQDCDYVITMGCSAKDVCPATWAGENRDWGLDDPDGEELDAVRAIRDEIEERVADLFAELAA